MILQWESRNFLIFLSWRKWWTGSMPSEQPGFTTCKWLFLERPNLMWVYACTYIWYPYIHTLYHWLLLLFCVAVAKANQKLHQGGLHGEDWSEGNIFVYSLFFHSMIYKFGAYFAKSIRMSCRAQKPKLFICPLKLYELSCFFSFFCPTAHRGFQEEMVHDGWQEAHVLQRSTGIKAAHEEPAEHCDQQMLLCLFLYYASEWDSVLKNI